MIVYVLPCEFMFIGRRKVGGHFWFDVNFLRYFPTLKIRRGEFSIRFFACLGELSPKFRFNCRTNAAKYRSKVRRYFEEKKVKFVLITFAQYCSRLLARQFACNLFQNYRFSESLETGLSSRETRLSPREKRDETGNLLLSSTVRQWDLSVPLQPLILGGQKTLSCRNQLKDRLGIGKHSTPGQTFVVILCPHGVMPESSTRRLMSQPNQVADLVLILPHSNVAEKHPFSVV